MGLHEISGWDCGIEEPYWGGHTSQANLTSPAKNFDEQLRFQFFCNLNSPRLRTAVTSLIAKSSSSRTRLSLHAEFEEKMKAHCYTI